MKGKDKEAPALPEVVKKLRKRVAELENQLLQHQQSREDLSRLEWMSGNKETGGSDYFPEYEDFNLLNHKGLIFSAVGKEQLKDIASEYINLLETSSAIYERNGDYTFGIFTSGWCRLMDNASRNLCGTDDNQETLASGRWLCRESCWKDASLKAITKGTPADVKCHGGINLYAVPVRAGGEIAGAISFGYGDPPRDEKTLKLLSDDYGVPVEKLLEQAKAYQSRPDYLIEFAKVRIQKAATHLGFIIDRWQAEQAVRNSEENFRTTLNAIGDAVISTDTSGRIKAMNPIAEKLTGWLFDQARDKPIEEIFRIIDVQTGKEVPDPVKQVLKSGAIVGLASHTVLISKNGEEYHIADSGAPIKDSLGQLTGVVLVFRDVTDDYRIRETLTESEARFHELFKHMSSCVAVYKAVDDGNDFEFLDFNQAAEKAEKIGKDELIGKRVTSVFPGVGDFGILDVFKRVWKSGNPEHHPISQYKDGRIVGWRENYVYKLPSGEIVALYNDVTDRKQAEEELRKLKKDLELTVAERTTQLREKIEKLDQSETALLYMVEDLNQVTAELHEESRKLLVSNQELEAFTYSVSHDLRAPLRAIDGYGNFLLEDYADRLDKEGKRFIRVIRDNATKMDRLISDLLNLSRVSRADMNLTQVSMSDIALSMYHEMATEEEKKTFDFSVKPMPSSICDVALIKQVWQNLIGNSLKYSSRSAIKKIEIEATEQDEETVFCIKDSGAGFNDHYAGKLFGVFQRLHSHDEFPGTGVGLAIVQRIVHRHGGKVWGTGKTGEGATFYFTLPRKTNVD